MWLVLGAGQTGNHQHRSWCCHRTQDMPSSVQCTDLIKCIMMAYSIDIGWKKSFQICTVHSLDSYINVQGISIHQSVVNRQSSTYNLLHLHQDENLLLCCPSFASPLVSFYFVQSFLFKVTEHFNTDTDTCRMSIFALLVYNSLHS